MGNIEDIVDSLENKISKLLHRLELLKIANLKLNEELDFFKANCSSLNNEVLAWKEKYEALKMANTILGSDDNKRETKLKINALIRDIDHCIAQLSD